MSTPRRKPGLERLADIIPDAVEDLLAPQEAQAERLHKLFAKMAAKDQRRDPTLKSIRNIKESGQW